MPDNNQEKKSIKLHIRDEDKCGVYSNVMAVSISPSEVILDFGYKMPQMPNEIQIVSRVNLSHSSAKQILTTLQNSLLDFDNKIKKK